MCFSLFFSMFLRLSSCRIWIESRWKNSKWVLISHSRPQKMFGRLTPGDDSQWQLKVFLAPVFTKHFGKVPKMEVRNTYRSSKDTAYVRENTRPQKYPYNKAQETLHFRYQRNVWPPFCFLQLLGSLKPTMSSLVVTERNTSWGKHPKHIRIIYVSIYIYIYLYV